MKTFLRKSSGQVGSSGLIPEENADWSTQGCRGERGKAPTNLTVDLALEGGELYCESTCS